jgi:2-polyprenyl-3-methyl-5-hydroxy-6-metoxy-1,4-benzoquinol methylase
VSESEPNSAPDQVPEMKAFDRFLRDARIARARPFVRAGATVLDIGCADGEMFRKWRGHIGRSVGIEPTLTEHVVTADYELLPGRFPEQMPSQKSFDVITMLAVLEHIPLDQQARLADACWKLLEPGGRVIITVPSPRVDDILHMLLKLHLIAGMSAHEHYGFQPADTLKVFAPPRFTVRKKGRFQLGLNNLFVFDKSRDDVEAA